MAVTDDLGRYRDVVRLGAGGMATVTLAEDTMLRRRVALKRVHADGDPRAITRLRREALVGASLSHPNLVSIYDVQIGDDGDLVIVMEYVAGQTLRDAIAASNGLPPALALVVLDGLAAALDVIHARGIVHRDVKPANILLGSEGAIKLADLGIAAAADRTRITSAGEILGTFSYMAPEQLDGATSTPGVDIYALAVVAFEMLSGQKARPQTNPVALAHAIATQPPPDLCAVWAEAPAAAAAVLRRGMAVDPAQRPRSAGELVSRLLAAIEPQGETGPVVRPGPRSATAEPLSAPSRSRPPSPLPAAEPVAAAEPLLAGGPRQEAALVVGAPEPRTAAVSDPPQARESRTPVPESPLKSRRPAPAPARASGPRDEAALAVGDRAPYDSAEPGPAPAQALGVPRRAPGKLPSGDAGMAVPRQRKIGMILAAIAAFAFGVLALALLDSGAKTPTKPVTRSSTPAGRTTGTPGSVAAAVTPAGTPGAGGTARSASGVSANPSPTSPSGAVQVFYQLAAHHDYAGAWALADPAARSQLAGYRSFAGQQSKLRQITFQQAQTVSQGPTTATVAVRTTPVLDSGTKHCRGTVRVVRAAGGSWMLDQLSISSCV